jgi:rsbT co-antagonist protein RsbR
MTWIRRQTESMASRRDLVSDAELRTDFRNLLSALRHVAAGSEMDISGTQWAQVRDLLRDLSAKRAAFGFSPSETATFIFSLKQPIFDRLAQEAGSDSKFI